MCAAFSDQRIQCDQPFSGSVARPFHCVCPRSPDVAAWFEQLFAEGQDTPIERSVDLVLPLASGKADALSGCFLGVDDDLEALLAQADMIQSEGRLRLQLAE